MRLLPLALEASAYTPQYVRKPMFCDELTF